MLTSDSTSFRCTWRHSDSHRSFVRQAHLRHSISAETRISVESCSRVWVGTRDGKGFRAERQPLCTIHWCLWMWYSLLFASLGLIDSFKPSFHRNLVFIQKKQAWNDKRMVGEFRLERPTCCKVAGVVPSTGRVAVWHDLCHLCVVFVEFVVNEERRRWMS